ncbi:hypothetical protein [Breznakiella homolactica]|uniref:Uncharacterized protein n=1 Tax=Breznakiella homolactica TaxID=2798577 RepID=A0A7T7XMB8_9SPIR|nr:hypothetical protein [Breznakiella homolactica]QQO08999.1 hypothetical protein JFL75_19025 [Breznakiella homolactica]
MVRELGWYLGDNRYTEITNRIEETLGAYGDAKARGADPDEQAALREQARELCEEHSVAAGLRTADAAYINIDAEFFEGNRLDEEAVDQFVKEVVKGHGYQRVLWTYMGTTGSLTQISKGEMELAGLQYEDYLPLTYQGASRSGAADDSPADGTTIPLYLYSDGSVSETYDRRKAKYRFDALQDESGIDWTQGYNPNGEVKKDGWYGAFDGNGMWVRVQEGKGFSDDAKKIEAVIRIFKDGDRAILYDPGELLLNAAELIYLTETGEEYGRLESDTEGMAAEIRAELDRLGADRISGIAGANEARLAAYREVLGDLAAADLAAVDRERAAELRAREIEQTAAAAGEIAGLRVERLIRAAAGFGSATAVLERGVIGVPLDIRRDADARALNITEEEAGEILRHGMPEGQEALYRGILGSIYANWGYYAGSGVSKAEMAGTVGAVLTGSAGGGIDRVITAETTLGAIMHGESRQAAGADETIRLYRSGIPGVFREPETVDFYDEKAREQYIQKLEKAKVLPKGGSGAALEALRSLPEKSEEQRKKINERLTRTLGQYHTISMSTGMPVGEVVSAAIAGTPAAVNPALQKKVYYEIPAEELVAAAKDGTAPIREVPAEQVVAELERTAALNESKGGKITIGGVGGKGLDEVGLGREVLERDYGYTGKEAEAMAGILHSIRVDEGLSPEVLGVLLETMKPAVAASRGKGATAAEAAAVRAAAGLPGVRYNLGNETGLRAYLGSEEYRTSGLSAEAVEAAVQDVKRGILREEARRASPPVLPGMDTKTTVPLGRNGGTATDETGQSIVSAENGTRSTGPAAGGFSGLIPAAAMIRPRYRSAGTTLPADRKAKKGTLETIAEVRNIGATAEERQEGGDTVVQLRSAGVELRSGFTYGGDSTDSILPGLIIGEGSGEGLPGVSAADLSGITEKDLSGTYGYSGTEAASAAAALNSMKVPEGREGYYKSELAPLVQTAVREGKTVEGLRQALGRVLKGRNDTAYNVASPEGTAGYRAGAIAHSGGMSERTLNRYIEQVRRNSGLAAIAGSLPAMSSMAGMASPSVYLRSLGNRSFGSSPSIHSGMNNRFVSLGGSGSSGGSVPTGGITGSGGEMNVLRAALGGVGPELSGGSGITGTTAGGTGSGVPVPSTRTPRRVNSGTAPAQTVRGMTTGNRADHPRTGMGEQDRELERLRKIEANYEQDKAELSKAKQPALARSVSHDVGHAEGTEDSVDLKKVAQQYSTDVLGELKKRKGV